MTAVAIAAGAAWAKSEPNTAAQTVKQKHHKMKKRGMRSAFLIQRGLPHYSMILMKLRDNKKLALTPDQKKRLEAIRNETIAQIMEIAPQVKKLRKKIVKAVNHGDKPETLASDVDKLAALKTKATKIQLDCMAKTRAVLTPKQMAFLKKHLKHKRKKMHKKHDK